MVKGLGFGIGVQSSELKDYGLGFWAQVPGLRVRC